MEQHFFIYLITNPNNKVIYTGMRNNLVRRVHEHKEKFIEGFTKKYNVVKLVYCEIHKDSYSAIAREKQIKGGPRKRKIELIEKMNPKWKDLSSELSSFDG